jgi:beta-phosphoglucomutase-like phosphatase (HAD superfamily)
MTPPGVQAALFDWSGTLVDDLDVVWRTNDQTLMSFGVEHLEKEEFRERFVLPWQSFYGSFGLGTKEKLKEVDSLFWRIYRPLSKEIKPFRETPMALERLRSRGIKIGVVTQTKRAPLLEQIGRFGLDGLIDCAVGEEDADELKPSPKPVLEALRRLGVGPERAVFTGDMVEDVISGRRAGVKVISIIREGSYQTEERVSRGGPFKIAHGMDEVTGIILGI